MTFTSTSARSVESAANDLIEKCGYAAAALTILPIPGSELLAVMPLHVGMVVKLGQLHGVDLDRDSATHLILRIGATVGLSLVGSRVATTAAKILLPGFGGLISAPFMYASTLAIGQVAVLYFQSDCDLSDHDLKATYAEAAARARKGFDPKRARSPEARATAEAVAQPAPAPKAAAPVPQAAEPVDPVARLERLRALRDAGALSAEEFEQAKRQVLASL
jgi:uncharacterized protein (DUF697 family)